MISPNISALSLCQRTATPLLSHTCHLMKRFIEVSGHQESVHDFYLVYECSIFYQTFTRVCKYVITKYVISITEDIVPFHVSIVQELEEITMILQDFAAGVKYRFGMMRQTVRTVVVFGTHVYHNCVYHV